MERPVKLHLYDVSRGLASRFSSMLTGKQVDGLWHTNLVVGEGDGAIEVSYGPPLRRFPAGSSVMGAPDKVIDIGSTYVSGPLLDDMLTSLGREKYTLQAYDLLYNNCNHFSNELSLLLTGSGIPDEVLSQTQAWLGDSPLGEYLMARWEQAAGGAAGAQQAPDVRPADAPSTSANPPPQGAAPAPAPANAGAEAPFEGLLRDLLRGFVTEQGGHPGAQAAARNVMDLIREAAAHFATATGGPDKQAQAATSGGAAAAGAAAATAAPAPATAAAAAGGPSAGCGWGRGGCGSRWGQRGGGRARGLGAGLGSCPSAGAGGFSGPWMFGAGMGADAFGFGPSLQPWLMGGGGTGNTTVIIFPPVPGPWAGPSAGCGCKSCCGCACMPQREAGPSPVPNTQQPQPQPQPQQPTAQAEPAAAAGAVAAAAPPAAASDVPMQEWTEVREHAAET